MGVLLPNHPEKNVVKGENAPNFKINTSKGTSSNVFQILEDLRLKQYEDQYCSHTVPTDSKKLHCTMLKQYKGLYNSSIIPSTALHPYKGQHRSSTMHDNSGKTSSTSITVQHMAQSMTSFRTTTPSTATTGRTTKQVNPVQAHPETSCKALLEHCMHVHQPVSQACKPGESLALRKVKHPHNGRTSVNRFPLMKQDILSIFRLF